MIRLLGAHPDRAQVVVIPYIKEGSTVGAVMCVRGAAWTVLAPGNAPTCSRAQTER